MRKEGSVAASIVVHTTDIHALANAIKICHECDDVNTYRETLIGIEARMSEVSSRADIVCKDAAPSITFPEAVVALKQIKVSDEGKRNIGGMFARWEVDVRRPRKRSKLDEIKKRTKCLGCGKVGHWFRDSPACTTLMKEKMKKKNGQE